jgi:hypothetical protein
MKLDDPNCNVYVNRDGTIRWEGDPVGLVKKVDDFGFASMGMRWRAELGDPANVDGWPPYRAVYAKTRAQAVAGVLEGVEEPSDA